MQLSSLIDEALPAEPTSCIPIAILPGEGIGPELMEACMPVLMAIEDGTPFKFDIEYGGKIGKDAYNEFGTSLTGEVSDFCQRAFQSGTPVFCGPGGHRFVYELRKRFDLFCKFVPLQPFPAMQDTGALRPSAVAGTDILLLRENVGGLYQGSWHTQQEDGSLSAHQAFCYDEHQVTRIMSVAVAAAESRRGSLCVVHKPGGAPAISELWVQVARQCAASSSVELRFLEVDTAAYLILAEARSFDVMVTPNMFGDVIADVAALLLGSRGMSYSFNLGTHGAAVYQTGHGAAYDLAGTQRANPLGQIQSLAALLAQSYGLGQLSDSLRTACNLVLAAGLRTGDIMSPGATLATTAEMGEAIAAALAQELQSPRQATGAASTV
jgi:3-isopropylmalate dehydrogenase